MSTNQETNDDQIRYWNSEQGQKWKNNQQALDRAFENISTRLLHHAGVQAGERVLDIGCGSGATSLEAAQHSTTSGSVLGVDVSEVLLELAKQRAKNMVGNIEFALVDAQSHPFRSESFDLAISRFGVMFFNNPLAAFTNIAKAIRPGGRISFVCWAPIDKNPWFQIAKKAAVKQLGKPEPVDPRSPGPFAFDDNDYVINVLSKAGLKNIGIEEEILDLVSDGSPTETAELACSLGPATRIIKEKNGSQNDYELIKTDVASALGDYQTEQGVRVPAAVNFVNCGR